MVQKEIRFLVLSINKERKRVSVRNPAMDIVAKGGGDGWANRRGRPEEVIVELL